MAGSRSPTAAMGYRPKTRQLSLAAGGLSYDGDFVVGLPARRRFSSILKGTKPADFPIERRPDQCLATRDAGSLRDRLVFK